jgi:hypothetical protein
MIEYFRLDQVINETIPTLKQLKQQGKLRYIGNILITIIIETLLGHNFSLSIFIVQELVACLCMFFSMFSKEVRTLTSFSVIVIGICWTIL